MFVFFTGILWWDWLFLPIGLFWIAKIQYGTDIFMVVFVTIIYYLSFQVLCYIAKFIISLLYIIIMPLCLISRKIIFINTLLHFIFFTSWTLIVYYFAVNCQINIRPLALILYASITLPFIYFCNENTNNISELALLYVAILKIVTFISCFMLFFYKINIDSFIGTFISIFILLAFIMQQIYYKTENNI